MKQTRSMSEFTRFYLHYPYKLNNENVSMSNMQVGEGLDKSLDAKPN